MPGDIPLTREAALAAFARAADVFDGFDGVGIWSAVAVQLADLIVAHGYEWTPFELAKVTGIGGLLLHHEQRAIEAHNLAASEINRARGGGAK